MLRKIDWSKFMKNIWEKLSQLNYTKMILTLLLFLKIWLLNLGQMNLLPIWLKINNIMKTMKYN